MKTRNQFRAVAGFIALMLCCVLTLVRVASAQSVFALTSQNRFGTLNLSNGAFSQIGAILPSTFTPFAIGFGAANQLYALDSANTLYTLSTTTGVLGPGVSLATPGNVTLTSLTGDANGNLWGLASTADGTDTQLLRVNPLGTASVVGSFGLPGTPIDGALAFDDTGTLFATPGAGGDSFYSVNTTTGAASVLTTSAGFKPLASTYGLVFRNNTLWVADDQGTLYNADRTTGKVTLTGEEYDVQQIGQVLGLAAPASFEVLPEPGTIVLMGLVGVGVLCRFTLHSRPRR